jgi:type IV pilus assembly protein PilV
MLKSQPKQRRHTQGFSLLEVLVAIVVLSVGLLGIAGLQIASLQSANATYQRSIANMQAQDLIDRLWGSACRHTVIFPTIRSEWITTHQNHPILLNWGKVDPAATSVTGTDVATYNAITNTYTINIRWRDKASGAQQSLSYTAQLPLIACN